uniref:hypothetical protein n=1 Tax=Pararhodobacter sp. SW119 TaxID=2780075 RepID=UPI001ADF6230
MELQSFNRSDGATASVDLFADIDLATQQGQADCKEARMNPREDLEDILRGTAFEIDGRSHPSRTDRKADRLQAGAPPRCATCSSDPAGADLHPCIR